MQPLRRSAPGRLLASPGWLLLVTASIALLSAALVAPVLFARAAESAALNTGLAQVEQDAFTGASANLRVTWNAVLPPASERFVRRQLAALPVYGPPVVTGIGSAESRGSTPFVASGAVVQPSALYYRDGAVERLGGTAGSRGVWLASDVADALGVQVGDPVRVGLKVLNFSVAGATTVVAGTFDRADGSALPVQLARDPGISARDLAWDPDRPGEGRPLMIADRATFGALVRKIHQQPLWTADLSLPADVTPQQARKAVTAVQRLGRRAFDDTTPLAAATNTARPRATRLSIASGLPDIVTGARETAATVRDQVAAFVGAGVVLAVVVVCAAAVLLGRSRRQEQDLLSGLGMRPHEIATLTALELLGPAVVGAVAGAGVAALLVATLGPPGRVTSWGPAAAQRTAFAALLAIALGAACAGVAAWSNDRRATSSRLGAVGRRVPWEAMLLVATVVTTVGVLGTDVARRPASPLAVVFPLLVAASVALLVLRGLERAGVRRWVRARVGSPRWLAGQRARTTAGDAAAITLSLAVGLAVLGYALAVHRGVTEGIDDKVAAQVGARTVVELADELAEPANRRPQQAVSPVHGGTVVYRGQARLPPAFGNQAVLAVDSRTFADAADWGGSGVLSRGRSALADLPGRRAALPVILAGDTERRVGDHGTLNFYDEWSAPYVVVAVVPAFPGSEAVSGSGEVTVVAEAQRLLRYMPRPLDPRLRSPRGADVAGGFSTWVWSTKAPHRVAAELDAARITPRAAVLRSDAAADTDLVAAGWTTGYVVALGGFALLIVAAATLVLAVRLADRDAVSDVLLRRMSYRARDLAAARTWEVAFAVGSSLVAAAVAIIVLAQGPSMIEPAARVAPLTRPLPGWTDAGLLVAACAVLVAIAGLIARRRAGARVPAEVLRGNG